MIHRINKCSNIATSYWYALRFSGTSRSEDNIRKRTFWNFRKFNTFFSGIPIHQYFFSRHHVNTLYINIIFFVCRKNKMRAYTFYHLNMAFFRLFRIQRNISLSTTPKSDNRGVSTYVIRSI